MNIYAKEGTKVKVTKKTLENGYKSQSERAKKYLKPGKIYTVLHTVVDRFNTEVYLKEFPGIVFNVVNFV